MPYQYYLFNIVAESFCCGFNYSDFQQNTAKYEYVKQMVTTMPQSYAVYKAIPVDNLTLED